MTSDPTPIFAFVVGMLGSVHCIGMCGGIVGALTMGLPEPIRNSHLRLLPYLMLYNGGRITSYVVAGALAGLLGSQIDRALFHEAQMVGHIIAGVFMVVLGLYLAGWWQALAILEKGGAKIWRYIEPLGRRFMPVRNPVQALGLGLIWGWLPCGLVYAALAWSLTAGSATQGGLLMLGFGLGTLPMLFAIGNAARWLGMLVRHPLVRQLAGTAVILFGLYSLFGPGHMHHGMNHEMAPGAVMDHSQHAH
jgi:sulfite exporter TauE/SafE